MIAKLPGNRSHLERLIELWSRDPSAKATAGRLRTLVGSVVITAMLDGLRDHRGHPRLALKGGRALELRLGTRARTSGDYDAAFRGATADALSEIERALERGWNGFTATLGERQEIVRAEVSPPPVRVPVRLSYKGKLFVTIPLELSGAEGHSLDHPEEAEIRISLTPVQLPGPRVAIFMPIRYQVAQKLHACTEVPHGRPNRRVHDIRDLLLIREFAVTSVDDPAIAAACVETFRIRNKQLWPPHVRIWPDWSSLWQHLADEEGFDQPLAEAVGQIEDWIQKLTIASRPFDGLRPASGDAPESNY